MEQELDRRRARVAADEHRRMVGVVLERARVRVLAAGAA